MKKIRRILVSIVSLFTFSFGFSQQTAQQLDSTNEYIVDSIYSIKSDFIGKPFANLLDAIGKNVRFSRPDGLGNRKQGMAYYDNPLIFLADTVGIPSRGFGVNLAQKMPVDLGKMWAVGLDQWDVLMRSYLRPTIVTAIRKID